MPILGIPIPTDLIPIPTIPKYWVKKVLPIPAHSHENMGIPGEFPNPKKSQKNQKISKKFPKLKNMYNELIKLY